MSSTVIFKENITTEKRIINDRKRQLIDNQRILKKRKELNPNNASRKKLGKIFKHIIGLSIIFTISGLLMVPFLIQIRSYLWEKNGKIEIEDDIIYNDFLINGLENSYDINKREYRYLSYTEKSLRLIKYKIKRGDTLLGIARKFNTSMDSIITANHIKGAYNLKVGSYITVPNIPGIFYKIKKGDTLSAISRKYNVSLNRIVDINDISSHVIPVGKRIFIPGASLSDWDRALILGNIFKTPTVGRLTSRMGFRRDPFTGKIAYHSGIDIANRTGTPVYSSQFGRVIYTGYKGNYGKTIIIAHPHGYRTLYGHLSRILVKRGQVVRQGQLIARMGNTGRSTGPHLHFEIHQYGKLVNPLKMIRLR